MAITAVEEEGAGAAGVSPLLGTDEDGEFAVVDGSSEVLGEGDTAPPGVVEEDETVTANF